MGDIQYYDGAAWASLVAKYYDGSAFTSVTPKYWDGSQWVAFGTTSSTLVDSFEDGDLSEYTGDTGQFTVDGTAPVFDGSYSLKCATSSFYKVISTSGLPAYPAAGNTIRVTAQVAGGDNIQVLYGVQDASNYYQVEANAANNQLKIGKATSGSFTASTIIDVTIPTAERITFDVSWGASGDHTFTLLDSTDSTVDTATMTGETTWTSGGIGLRGKGNLAWDNYRYL